LSGSKRREAIGDSVSLEQKQCPVCGEVFETRVILFDMRLRGGMRRRTVTGWQLCPEHQALSEAGYVALVEATRADSLDSKTVQMEDTERTGQICHMKRESAKIVLGIDNPELDFVFVEPGVIQHIQEFCAAVVAAKITEKGED
jgi:hypothetical protein